MFGLISRTPVQFDLHTKTGSCLRSSLTEPRHEISNNVVCTTSKASDQTAHTRSLIKAFASRLNIP